MKFRKNTELIIALALIVVAGFFYILSTIFCSLNALLVNLSAGCVTALIVIIVVERLRKKENELKFAEINKISKSDIGLQANMLISYMASPLGFSIYNYSNDEAGYTPELIRKNSRLMLEDILKNDLNVVTEKMSVTDWRHFAQNLTMIKYSLTENIRVYGNVLPPEILGKILAVRKAFNNLNDFSFAVFMDLFVQEEKDWRPNKFGNDRNKKLRAGQLPRIDEDLKKYFSEVKEFFELLDTLNFY